MDSCIRLLSDLRGFINFDAQVAHRAFQFRVAQKQLYSTQVPSTAVDQGCFGPAHRVGAVGARLEASFLHPAVDNPGVLPR